MTPQTYYQKMLQTSNCQNDKSMPARAAGVCPPDLFFRSAGMGVRPWFCLIKKLQVDLSTQFSGMNKQFILCVDSSAQAQEHTQLLHFFSRQSPHVSVQWIVSDPLHRKTLFRISLPREQIAFLKDFIDTRMPVEEAELYELVAW